jgi:hypothetical protein
MPGSHMLMLRTCRSCPFEHLACRVLSTRKLHLPGSQETVRSIVVYAPAKNNLVQTHEMQIFMHGRALELCQVHARACQTCQAPCDVKRV